MSDEPNALDPQMIKELGFGVDLVTTFETSGGGGAGVKGQKFQGLGHRIQV